MVSGFLILFNRGKISEKDFNEIPDLLNQFTTYRNRISNKDLNSYKTLEDLADILAQVVDDDSMLTPSQKTKFLKRVKSGKIKVDKSDDFDVVLDTPRFVVYVPNTHEASMNLGKGTKWCTAHENPEWYEKYTENGHKLYIVKDKKTGERWQYSDKNGDFLNQDDEEFDVMALLGQDDAEKLSKFFEQFLGVDYYNFDGTWIYDGKEIPDDLAKRVENIVISDSATSIVGYAFYNCSSLKSITIPNSVTSIGSYAFYNCSSLKSITIPNSIVSIGGYAFSCCSSLKSITIPNSVTSIGRNAFSNCIRLTSITIPNSVTSIGWWAFYDCSSLTNITILNSVTNIGDFAFKGCSKLIVHTDNDYIVDYCKKRGISVKSLKANYESYKPLKLRIREY